MKRLKSAVILKYVMKIYTLVKGNNEKLVSAFKTKLSFLT